MTLDPKMIRIFLQCMEENLGILQEDLMNKAKRSGEVMDKVKGRYFDLCFHIVKVTSRTFTFQFKDTCSCMYSALIVETTCNLTPMIMDRNPI